MNTQFSNPTAIKAVRLNHIQRCQPISRDKTILELTHAPVDIPFHSGSARWTVQDSQTPAGTEYNTTISFAPKEAQRMPRWPMLLILEFCDGSQRLIGSPYLPVFLQSTETQQSKQIEIRHRSTHFPTLTEPTIINP